MISGSESLLSPLSIGIWESSSMFRILEKHISYCNVNPKTSKSLIGVLVSSENNGKSFSRISFSISIAGANTLSQYMFSSLLHKLGINTIGDLANCSTNKLEPYFKNRTVSLINSARGIDDSEVITEYGDNKSISISRTFDHDLSDFFDIKSYLLDYANIVGMKIRKKNLYAKTICITIKDNNFKNYSHQKGVSPTNNTMDIYNTLVELFFECKNKNLIRAIGVRISNFIENNDININKTQEVLDKINDKYNNNVIMPAIYFENNKKSS